MLLLLREMSSFTKNCYIQHDFKQSLSYQGSYMISTFVLWTPCEAVYMFLTVVQKLQSLSKTKKRCVGKEEGCSVFESAPMCHNVFKVKETSWNKI